MPVKGRSGFKYNTQLKRISENADYKAAFVDTVRAALEEGLWRLQSKTMTLEAFTILFSRFNDLSDQYMRLNGWAVKMSTAPKEHSEPEKSEFMTNVIEIEEQRREQRRIDRQAENPEEESHSQDAGQEETEVSTAV